eukprot:14024150-Alexandrium_andersonii.AAC.1
MHPCTLLGIGGSRGHPQLQLCALGGHRKKRGAPGAQRRNLGIADFADSERGTRMWRPLGLLGPRSHP